MKIVTIFVLLILCSKIIFHGTNFFYSKPPFFVSATAVCGRNFSVLYFKRPFPHQNQLFLTEIVQFCTSNGLFTLKSAFFGRNCSVLYLKRPFSHRNQLFLNEIAHFCSLNDQNHMRNLFEIGIFDLIFFCFISEVSFKDELKW